MAKEDEWVEARREAGDDARPILSGCAVDDVDAEIAKPIIFVHGLGVGLAPYLPNIAQLLRSKPGRKIALLS